MNRYGLINGLPANMDEHVRVLVVSDDWKSREA